jgi:hypothetical protein
MSAIIVSDPHHGGVSLGDAGIRLRPASRRPGGRTALGGTAVPPGRDKSRAGTSESDNGTEFKRFGLAASAHWRQSESVADRTRPGGGPQADSDRAGDHQSLCKPLNPSGDFPSES